MYLILLFSFFYTFSMKLNYEFCFRYVGLCGGIKIVALGIFMADWWLVRRRRHLDTVPPLDPQKDIAGSIISLDKR